MEKQKGTICQMTYNKSNIKTCVGYHWQYVPEDDFYDP